MALQMSPATYRYPGVTGLFPGLPEEGGLELGPTKNQNQNSSSLPRGGDQFSNPQLRLRALRPDFCVQDQGTRKTGKDRMG